MGDTIAIYCVCFPKHEPLKFQKYQKNIMCNAHSILSDYRAYLVEKEFLFDDVGENISELNGVLGDLTATYWIWKNSEFDIVGTSQYRRFWDTCVTSMDFEKNTLYVQDPIVFTQSLKEQYIACHGELGISILDKLAADNIIPLTTDMLDKNYAVDYLHSCNMFIAHKDVYDKFCELLFDIVFKVYDACKDELQNVEPYNRRIPAFLGERIMMALIVNKEYFFPKLNIVPLPWAVEKKSLLQKIFKK